MTSSANTFVKSYKRELLIALSIVMLIVLFMSPSFIFRYSGPFDGKMPLCHQFKGCFELGTQEDELHNGINGLLLKATLLDVCYIYDSSAHHHADIPHVVSHLVVAGMWWKQPPISDLFIQEVHSCWTSVL